jgi:uncharacterized membrane protein YcgQ (UPF0703/DUF1980 family)
MSRDNSKKYLLIACCLFVATLSFFLVSYSNTRKKVARFQGVVGNESQSAISQKALDVLLNDKPLGSVEETARFENADSQKAAIEIKEKMFIAQTNDVYLNQDDYLGKTIKLQVLFKAAEYGDRSAYFVLRYGPGCCGSDGQAGFEVMWDNATASAGPYPQVDDWVEAVGTLKSYVEDDFPYLYIALSSLNILPTRGSEVVTQ